MRAIWNGAVLAESDDTVVVEGNHYFPEGSLDRRYVVESDTHTSCPWKGRASYYSVEVDGRRNEDAVWYYPDPSPGAEMVRDRVAFWRGVKVVPSEREDGSRQRDASQSSMPVKRESRAVIRVSSPVASSTPNATSVTPEATAIVR